MSAPQIGDVITTAEELDALPIGAAILDCSGLPLDNPLYIDGWRCINGQHGIPSADVIADGAPLVLVYLPGQPPRPERAIKAEAVREAAESLFYDGDTDHARPGYYLLVMLAERIERGEP